MMSSLTVVMRVCAGRAIGLMLVCGRKPEEPEECQVPTQRRKATKRGPSGCVEAVQTNQVTSPDSASRGLNQNSRSLSNCVRRAPELHPAARVGV